jgi:hypothetical protein
MDFDNRYVAFKVDSERSGSRIETSTGGGLVWMGAAVNLDTRLCFSQKFVHRERRDYRGED